MDARRAEDRGMIVETGVGANASFACGLAGDTTCVFVTNPLIGTTTERRKEGEDSFKTEVVRERKSKSSSRLYSDLRGLSGVDPRQLHQLWIKSIPAPSGRSSCLWPGLPITAAAAT